MNQKCRIGWVCLLAFACLMLRAGVSEATLFNLSLDTSALVAHPAGPFSLEFQLNDGVGTGDGNNTATLSNFSFGTGGPLGSATRTGGATGDLGTSVSLVDSSFFNQLYQAFTPGLVLSFDLDLTTVVDPGPQPDQFSFAILDCNLVEIPTHGPADALTLINVDSANPTPQSFASDVSHTSACGGGPISIPTPVVQPIPEPAPIALLAPALVALVTGEACRRRITR